MLPPARVRPRRDEARAVVEASSGDRPRPRCCSGLCRDSRGCAVPVPWLLAPICGRHAESRTVMASPYVAAFGRLDLIYVSTGLYSVRPGGPPPSVPAVPPAGCSRCWRPRSVIAVRHAAAVAAGSCPAGPWPGRCCGRCSVVPARAGRRLQNTMFGVIAVWVLAAALIGWRAAKGIAGGPHVRPPDGSRAAGRQPPGRARRRCPRPGGPAAARPAGAGDPGRARAAGHSPAQYGTARAGRRPGVRGPRGPRASRPPRRRGRSRRSPSRTRWPNSTR